MLAGPSPCRTSHRPAHELVRSEATSNEHYAISTCTLRVSVQHVVAKLISPVCSCVCPLDSAQPFRGPTATMCRKQQCHVPLASQAAFACGFLGHSVHSRKLGQHVCGIVLVRRTAWCILAHHLVAGWPAGRLAANAKTRIPKWPSRPRRDPHKLTSYSQVHAKETRKNSPALQQVFPVSS